MAKYPGLYPRSNGAWYVRKRVPVDLMHVEPRAQIRLSLETTEKKAAIKRYHAKMQEIDQHFDALRNGLRLRGKVAGALAAGRLERLGEREINELACKWWQSRREAREPSVEDPGEIADMIAMIDDEERALGAIAHDSEVVRSVADSLLVDAGMAARSHVVGKIKTQVQYPIVDRGTPAYRHLCGLVARALSAERSLAKDHLLGRQDAVFDPLFNVDKARLPDEVAEIRPRKRLTDLFTAYRSERSALRGEESTEKKYGFSFRVMEEVLGPEKPVEAITRADCIEIRKFFQRLPPNAKKRFPNLTLSEIAERADRDNLARLAPNSVGSYMQSVLAVLRWAEDEGWSGKINTRDLVPEREALVERRGFRADELRLLFDALEQFRETEPEKFWVPALAVFTGARANEICQLRSEDIVDIEGISCLNFSLFDAGGRRVDGKRLKTKTSARYVPLHPCLIEAGFLTFVASQKADRLFPRLQMGSDGRYSEAFSKWFGRFKKKLGFNEPALVFHSFRHGFRDACRNVDGILDETAEALGGWASDGQAARYGNRGMVPVLHRAIMKLDFGGFTLGGPTITKPHGDPMSSVIATGCNDPAALEA